MKKNQILGLIRNILLALASAFTMYANQKGLESVFTVNIAMSIFSIAVVIWGVADKSLKGFSYISSIVRSIVSLVSGILLGLGTSNEIMEFLPIASGLILSILSVLFSVQVNGNIEDEIKAIEIQAGQE